MKKIEPEHDNKNNRNGIASIMQIMASSTMEHDVMYANVDACSPFDPSYLRHTTFDKESLHIDLGYVDMTREQNIYFQINDTDIDMIGNMFIRIDFPVLDMNYKWINSVGNAIIKEIKILIGDYELYKCSGNYLQIRFLTDTAGPHYVAKSAMIGYYNSKYSLNEQSRACWIEIPFMKSAMDQQYFPLFMSKRKPLSVLVTLRSLSELIFKDDVTSNNIGVGMRINEVTQHVYINFYKIIQNISNTKIRASLYYDNFRLSGFEKNLFNNNSSELLFTQIQETTIRFEQNQKMTSDTFKLKGNILELVIVLISDNNIDNNLHFKFLPLSRINITINNIPLINKDTDISANLYRLKQPHIRTPDTFVYVIPFNLSSHITQPSGSLNFDKMSGNNKITLTRDQFFEQSCTAHIFGVSYNSIYLNNGSLRVQNL